MCPSYANVPNIGEMSEETPAMTLPVNTCLAGRLSCSACFIVELRHNTLLEEFIIFNITFPVLTMWCCATTLFSKRKTHIFFSILRSTHSHRQGAEFFEHAKGDTRFFFFFEHLTQIGDQQSQTDSPTHGKK